MRSFGRSALRFARSLAGSHLLVAALFAGVLTSVAPSLALAQEHAAPAPPAQVDIITPHITDSYELEVPWFNSHFAKEVCIGRHLEGGHCGPLWDPVHIGRFE